MSDETDLQSKNASEDIVFKELGSSIDSKALQFAKALWPIESTELPNETNVSFSQFSKAFSPITFTELGIVSEIIPRPLKTPPGIFSTVLGTTKTSGMGSSLTHRFLALLKGLALSLPK